MVTKTPVLNLILLVMTFIGSQALASVHGMEPGRYNCSNGKTYDVATYYSGGYGPAERYFIAFCSVGTLEMKFHGWQFPEEIPSVQTCIEDSRRGVERCMEEFLEFNPIAEDGQFTNRNFAVDINQMVQSGEGKK